MRTQAEIFAVENSGKYNGTNALGTYDDSIGQCTDIVDKFDGTLFDDDLSSGVNKLVTDIGNTRPTSPIRVYCAVGGDGVNSWAFATPLHNPKTGMTGFCVDSSGVVKDVNLDFSIGGDLLGGGATVAACP